MPEAAPPIERFGKARAAKADHRRRPLDYSKGTVERFNGYGQFLEEHPDWQRKAFLLESRPHRAARSMPTPTSVPSSMVSGRINGAFADADWVPIRYVNRGYARPQLTGFYRAADVSLITPLRTG